MHKKHYIIIIILFKLIFICSTFYVRAYETEYDFGGNRITIAGNLAGWDFDWNNGEDRDRLRKVQQKFNVNINFDLAPGFYGGRIEFKLGGGQWEAMPIDVPKGKKPFDIGFIPTGVMAEGYYKYMLPLNDILTEDIIERLPEQAMPLENMPTIGGKIYAIELPGSSFFKPNLIYWNKDLFAELNLPDLYDLMEEDKWTWDKMLEIARKATQDTTGDGHNDIWGFGTEINDVEKGDGLFQDDTFVLPLTNDASVVRYENGKYIYSAQEDPFLEALNFRKKIYDEDLETGSNALNEWRDGNVAMFPNHDFEKIEDRDFEIGIAYFPRGPEMEEHVFPVNTGTAVYFPKTIDHEPEALLELVLALYDVAKPYTDLDKLEKNYWDILQDRGLDVIRDKRALKVYKNIYLNSEWDFTRPMMGRNSAFLEAIPAVIRGEIEAEEALKQMEFSVQMRLDDLFN